MKFLKQGHVKCIPDTLKVAFILAYYLNRADADCGIMNKADVE